MRQTLKDFRAFAARFKFISSLLVLFWSGAWMATLICVWYYGGIMDQQVRAYDRQVARLTHDVDVERTVNRDTIIDVVEQLTIIAAQTKAAAETAGKAATTARGAARTAKGAATNAAKANITRVETKAVKVAKQVTPPKRIQTREVEP